MQDVLKYCAIAAVLHVGIFMLYIATLSQHPHGTASVITHVGDFLVSLVPTGIPAMLNFSLTRCTLNLKKEQVAVLQTARIKTVADTEVVVFDKTGTLTGNLVRASPPACFLASTD